MPIPKHTVLAVRLPRVARRLIARAARLSGKTPSAYMRDAAITAANSDLKPTTDDAKVAA